MTKEVGFYCVLDFGLGVNYLTWKMLLELNVTAPPQFLQGTIRKFGILGGGVRNNHICMKSLALFMDKC